MVTTPTSVGLVALGHREQRLLHLRGVAVDIAVGELREVVRRGGAEVDPRRLLRRGEALHRFAALRLDRSPRAVEVAAGGEEARLLLGRGADDLGGDVDARLRAERGGAEVAPVELGDGGPVLAGVAEEVGEGERQSDVGGEVRGVVAGAEEPDLRRGLGRRAGPRLHRGERVVRLQAVVQVADEVHDLLGEGLDVGGALGVGEREHGGVVAARRAPDAEVDAPGVERLQDGELLGDLEGGVVGEHDAAAADADAGGVREELADEDLRAGAGVGAGVVVLGDPVAGVAEALGGLGHGHGVAQGVRGRLAAPHRRLVGDAEREHQ